MRPSSFFLFFFFLILNDDMNLAAALNKIKFMNALRSI